MAAVQQSGSQLHSASERLRHDRQIVAAAIQENHNALQYASESLRDNKEMALLTLPHGALRVVSDRLRDDPPETVLAFLEQKSWDELPHTSERLQNDIAFVSSTLSKEVESVMKEGGDEVNTLDLFSRWNHFVGASLCSAVRTTSEAVQERDLLSSTKASSFTNAVREWQTQYMEKVWLLGRMGRGLSSSQTSIDSANTIILEFAGFDAERTFLENARIQAAIIDVASGSVYGLSWQEWLRMVTLPDDHIFQILLDQTPWRSSR